MESDLLPMSTGDVFDEAFDLYKRNFALFAGIVAVIHVPASIIWAFAYRLIRFDRLNERINDANGPAIVIGLIAFLLIAIVIYSFVIMIQQGALVLAVSKRYLGMKASMAN